MRHSYFTHCLALILATTSACATTSNPRATSQQAQPSLVSQGNQFAKDGLLREAVEMYKKAIAKDPNNLAAYRNLGIVLVKAGDNAGAITNLEKAMPEFDNNFDANFYLGEAYRAEDKYAEAIFRYKNALKIQEDEPRAMKSLAWSYFKIRFYSEALNTAQRVQKKNPEDEQAPIILARTQLKLKRENEALATLKKGSEKASKAAQPYYHSVTAEVLAAQGKSKEAMETWRKALKAQPMLAGALMGTGQILLAEGKKKEAVEFLERAVRIKPKMFEGHYWLARGLEESNPERSLKYFNHFRKNAANDPEFTDLIQDARKRTAALSTRVQMEQN